MQGDSLRCSLLCSPCRCALVLITEKALCLYQPVLHKMTLHCSVQPLVYGESVPAGFALTAVLQCRWTS